MSKTTEWALPFEDNLIGVDELIDRESPAQRGSIVVEANPRNEGGAVIYYNDKVVATGLNVWESFITLAGMLRNGPVNVQIVMPVVSKQFTNHYLAGYRATAQEPATKKRAKK